MYRNLITCFSFALVVANFSNFVIAGAAFEINIQSSQDSSLRSAFLRESAWPKQSEGRSAEEIQSELRNHFAVVLRTLVVNSPQSLTVSAQRLLNRTGDQLTAEEHQRLMHFLAMQRRINLGRLAQYARTGRFPQNLGYSETPVPVFVDAQGTDCAVGHLMRMSGWGQSVDEIAQSNLFVYVDDIHSGPVVDWVLYSGLTIEEAAMIQPAYAPPPHEATLTELSLPGATLEQPGTIQQDNYFFNYKEAGLKFSNFRIFERGNFPFYDYDVPYSNPSNVGVSLGWGTYYDEGIYEAYNPILPRWLFLGSINSAGIISSSGTFGEESILISYNVETIEPGAVIDKLAVRSSVNVNYNFSNSFPYPPYTGIELRTFVYDGDELIAELDLSEYWTGFNQYYLDDSAIAHIGRDSIQVYTLATVYGDSQFTSLFYEFTALVPEPTSLTLLALGCCLTFVGARKR